ncbi:MAG: carbon-nitrogen hydrolase [Planctomycetes bacterium]|nr:carbon-nitrogen hydrolase [Planctomycetota bacterium]MBL7009205.1 carbon-nitrogen hydrolase [Planctomycetota bacterium]
MDCLAALCQMRPALGDLDRNLEAHFEWLDRAAGAGAGLVLFPELSLTGYFLRDLTQEIAVGLDDPRVRRLVARSKERSIVFGLVEESRDHRYYNSAVFAEDGEIKHVHRKVHLPDYGIFEEGRYFASGDRFEVVDSKLGRFGILVCEDAWHLSAGWLHFLDGADALLVPCASPARGVDTDGPELSSETAWRTLTAALALFFQSWVLHCNRVGFEDGAMYWGASSVVTPFGQRAAEAAGEHEELLLHRLSSDPTRRARMFTPLRRDARPDLVRRHLARLLEDPDALKAAGDEAPASRPAQD